MKGHSYLFEEARWKATGRYWDSGRGEAAVRGELLVTHGSPFWTVDGRMHTEEGTVHEYVSRYEVTPVEAGGAATRWSAANPLLGKLEGRFVVVEDSILSFFQTGDGRYCGTEYYLQVDKTTYQNRGTLFEDHQLVSSWSVVLKRI